MKGASTFASEDTTVQARACRRWALGLAVGWVALGLTGSHVHAEPSIWTNTASANWSAPGPWLGGRTPPASGGNVEFKAQAVGASVTATADAAWATAGGVNRLTFQLANADASETGVNTLAGSGLTSFTIGSGGVRTLSIGPAATITGDRPLCQLNLPVTLDGSQTWEVLAPSLYSIGIKAQGYMGAEAQLTVLNQANGAASGTVLTKCGSGRLDLRGANGALGGNVSEFVLQAGSLYMLNGTAAGSSASRIPDTCKITSEGGAVYMGLMPASATEDVGELKLNNGLFWYTTHAVLDGSGATPRLRFASLNATVGPAAALTIDISQSIAGPVRFQNVAGFPNQNGIVGGWAWHGASRQWLAPPTANADLAGVAGTARNNATINAAAAAENVYLTTDATITLTANRTFNSLRANAGSGILQTLDLGGYELRLAAGALANAWSGGPHSTGFTIQNGTLTVGAADNSGGTLYITGGGNGITARHTAIGATITDNGSGVVNLVRYMNDSGGVLYLNGNNTYSGFTAILKHAIQFGSDGANPGDAAPLGKVPAAFVADSIRLSGGELRPSATLTLHANRGIQLAGPGGTLGSDGIPGVSATYNGVISGSGDLYVQPRPNSWVCAWTLGGANANTYAGKTFVQFATLTLNKPAGTTAVPGDLFLTDSGAVLLLNSEQIADTAVVYQYTKPGTGVTPALRLNGKDETVGGLVAVQCAGTPNPNVVVENLTGSFVTSTLTLNTVADALYRYEGILQNGNNGALALVKTGAGTQELLRGAGNTHTGGTTIDGGTLRVSNASGSGTGTGPVTVGASGTLAGTGIVKPTGANAIAVSGTVAPGASVGTLTFDLSTTSAGVTFNSGAKLSVELGAPGTGDMLKFLNVGSGDLSLNGTTVDIVDVGGLAIGTYTLMTFYADGGATLTNTGKPTGGLTLGTHPAAAAGAAFDYSEVGKINLRVLPRGTAILLR